MKPVRVDRLELGAAGCFVAERQDRGLRLRMLGGLAASCVLLAMTASARLAVMILVGFMLPHLWWLHFAWGRDTVALDREKLRIRELRPFKKTRGRAIPRERIGGLRLRRDTRILASMEPYPPWFWRFRPINAWVLEIFEGPARKACVELLATRDEAHARSRAQELAGALGFPLEEASPEKGLTPGEVAWVWWRGGVESLFHFALVLAALRVVGAVWWAEPTPGCDGMFRATALAVDPAAAKVYWIDPVGGVIRRSELDGSTEEALIEFVQPSFGDLDLDLEGRKVYWSERRSRLLRRANLDGTQVEQLASGRDAARVAIDTERGHVYWAQRDAGEGDTGATASFWRANLDGSDAARLPWRISDNALNDVAVSSVSGHFYWIGAQDGWPVVSRIPLSRGESEVVFTRKGVDRAWGPATLAIDPADDTLFWIDNWSDSIQRATPGDADFVEVTAAEAVQRAYLSLDPIRANVYWSDGCRIHHAPVETQLAGH